MVLFVFFHLSVSWRSFFLPFVCPACSFLPPFIPHSLLCNYMGVCHTRYWEPLLRTNSSLNLAALVSDNLAYSWQSFRFFKTEGCKSWEDAGLVQHSEKKFLLPQKQTQNKTQRNKSKKKANDRDGKPTTLPRPQQSSSWESSIRECRGCPWFSGLLGFYWLPPEYHLKMPSASLLHQPQQQPVPWWWTTQVLLDST